MVREMPGAQNTFRDLVSAVRSLEERIPLAPPASLPPADAALPAKTWSPAMPRPPKAATTKFLYHELAPRPVVVNPLTNSPFSPWDQYEMAYWNRYSGDLFRVLDPPASTWAYNNGVSDMVGFPDDTVMKRQFGYDWTDLGDGVVGVTFARREGGIIVEADVAFNPHKSWTLDDLAATGGQDKIYAFKEACLHELGHVWGLNHPFDDDATVTWDSVMDYKPRQYWVGELFADDTAAVRHAFPPGVPIRDGLISSYVTVLARSSPSSRTTGRPPLHPRPSGPAAASAWPGRSRSRTSVRCRWSIPWWRFTWRRRGSASTVPCWSSGPRSAGGYSPAGPCR
jgi:hypothetical protein